MLFVSTKAFRTRAAIAFALLYALCVLAPPAAFAFSHNPHVAHCLIDDHVAVSDHHGGNTHVHADGTAHRHHDDGAPHKTSGDDGKGQAANCCGLFFTVAIPGNPGFALELISRASVVLPTLGDDLSGRGPDRINRPPIA
jgi:hypothetical protein